MPRRGENIFKRQDGRWEARYIHHYENGKAKYRYIYASTYTEARAKKLQEQKCAQKFVCSREKMLADFSTVAIQYLETRKISVKESTYARYHRILYKYVLPKIGSIRLEKLDSAVLNGFSQELALRGGAKGKGLSPKTVSDILCLVKSVLSYGEKNGFPRVVLAGVPPTQRPRAKADVFSSESRKKLEKALLCSECSTSLGILFALFTGVRIGELCGLRWGDVDALSRTVCIRRTVERIADLGEGAKSKTKIIISEPKTENSVRVIPLPSFLAEMLEKKRRQKDFYIISESRKPLEPHCFYVRYKQFLKKHSLPEHTFHALRHTFATECVKCGFDAKSLSEILGHASVNVTMALYVHPSIEQKRAQMDLLQIE